MQRQKETQQSSHFVPQKGGKIATTGRKINLNFKNKKILFIIKEAENHHSHFTELLKLKLPRDHLMSPMYAPSEVLAKMPPMCFVVGDQSILSISSINIGQACHLDPLLDDTIMFAKRVRDSGGCVKSVDLLDNLPHGFLNFAPMSTDCREGANLCLERIKQLLGM